MAKGSANLLRRAGYGGDDVAAAVDAVSGRASLRALPVGLDVRVADDGFAFTTRNGRDIFAIDDPEEGWVAFSAIRPVERYLAFAQGVIDDSIYRAAGNSDIPDDALAEYIRVMGFSVDFQREIRSGDAFELLYEQQIDQISGKKIATTLHYAGLMLSGDQLGYYRYDHDGSRVGWYDRNGNSAARTLIRTPISGARLSSSYGMRKHPISGYNRMHKGVDFAAPTGTPIIAAGSGVVTRSGWNGSYGRYIRIRHNSTYDTAYAHMSRIARGVTPGARVEQGQVIGYVGSTGRSTGPHLHYEILVNNRKVNPLTVSLPTGEKVPAELIEDFRDQVELVEAEMIATGSVRFAAMDLLPSERGVNLAVPDGIRDRQQAGRAHDRLTTLAISGQGTGRHDARPMRLEAGKHFPGDRRFAITNGHPKQDEALAGPVGEKIPVPANDEVRGAGRASTAFHGTRLMTLSKGGEDVLTADLMSAEGRRLVNEFFAARFATGSPACHS